MPQPPPVNIFYRLLSEKQLSPSDVHGVVATGYGRNSVSFADRTLREIMCHRREAALFMEASGSCRMVLHWSDLFNKTQR
jgi:activator of 2-hydroxyglutaryl-CoA dehydratase